MSMSPHPTPHRHLRTTAATALTLTLTALALTSTLPATAAPTPDPVQHALDRLVQDDGYPAAWAATTDRDGRTRQAVAGVADLRTGAKASVDGRTRAASVNKSFTAVAVLQLVGEGKVSLDAPVEKYLPGLLRGNGIDGRRITVRHLLQHTSGLPDYTRYLATDLADMAAKRHRYYQPRTLLDLALRHKAVFPPGKGWQYSSTGYVVAGLLVEQVTGRPLNEEITHRVINRAGLRNTYLPTPGDQQIQGPHPHGYSALKQGTPFLDVTQLDPSSAWAAGSLISTPNDLNRFLSALLTGKLLRPAQLAQMRTTVAIPADSGYPAGTRFGLGISSQKLSCGGLRWGQEGDFLGYATSPGATDDGRTATVAVNANPGPAAQGRQHVDRTLDTALCSLTPRRP
ncbi:serine hydrolase [Streptomyces spiroverticillatus]|uniref:Serine hydrolase n=1 Tax=Streptomyces finlayi TaxID=67296 RepID=A0A918WSU9_9ACTN|nr:serine hydrolase domain-containing protein [Streptomyces finlayi]GGZ86804.1 serine hydrolase [Streptomyces spiroverticillatus]GHC78259.1 serine hydrolase [Streptomyces finlayi]